VPSNRGLYALDDPEYRHNLTSGEPLTILPGGHWIEGCVEHSNYSTQKYADVAGREDTLFYALLMSFEAELVYTCAGTHIPRIQRKQGREENMNMRTILIVALVLTLVFIISLAILYRRRKTRLSRRIVAAITQIQVESGRWSNWWVVTAQWLDTQTGQTITFRSGRLEFRPKKHIGEGVPVDFDPNHPTHYRIEL
jgi:hypothetical protein